jgi:hypothetical protein
LLSGDHCSFSSDSCYQVLQAVLLLLLWLFKQFLLLGWALLSLLCRPCDNAATFSCRHCSHHHLLPFLDSSRSRRSTSSSACCRRGLLLPLLLLLLPLVLLIGRLLHCHSNVTNSCCSCS